MRFSFLRSLCHLDLAAWFAKFHCISVSRTAFVCLFDIANELRLFDLQTFLCFEQIFTYRMRLATDPASYLSVDCILSIQSLFLTLMVSDNDLTHRPISNERVRCLIVYRFCSFRLHFASKIDRWRFDNSLCTPLDIIRVRKRMNYCSQCSFLQKFSKNGSAHKHACVKFVFVNARINVRLVLLVI